MQFSKNTIFFILLFSSFQNSFAQENLPTANKNIGICGHYADTLLFEQIKNCDQITLNSNKKVEITSYTLSYYLENKMTLTIINGFGSSLSKENMEQLKGIKPEAVFIEEVLGESENEILILGNRWIYIKY